MLASTQAGPDPYALKPLRSCHANVAAFGLSVNTLGGGAISSEDLVVSKVGVIVGMF